MKKDCIVYLGGSIPQSTNLKYFIKKKIKIILIDKNPKCYCKKLCNDFLNVSHNDIPTILFKLNKIVKKKNYKIIDTMGIAHYSYPAVNAIKKKYIDNYKKDNFLMSKHVQKKILIKSKLTPEYLNIPKKKTFLKKRTYFMNKIFNFYKNSNYKVFIKPTDTHQGIGIIKINHKIKKNKFINKFFDIIVKNFKFSNNLYLEKAILGKLINLDFIKKKNGDIIFLPLTYRDKIKLHGEKKYITFFEYLNNKNTISNRYISRIKDVLEKKFHNKKIFGTIDFIQNKDKINILEISPHFHHVKLQKFLNNIDPMDIYFENNKQTYEYKNISETSIGGSIFLNNKSRVTENLIKFVRKNSVKTIINDVQKKNKKKNLKENFSLTKQLTIIYFKCDNLKNLQKIYLYMSKNKKKLFNLRYVSLIK